MRVDQERGAELDGSPTSFVATTAEPGPGAAGEPALVLANDGAAWSAMPTRLRQRLVWPVCLAAALALHVSVALALLPHTVETLGDAGVAMEAVSVDLIEQVPSVATPTIEGADASASESEAKPERQEPEQEPPRPDSAVAPEPPPPESEAIAAAPETPTPIAAEPEPVDVAPPEPDTPPPVEEAEAKPPQEAAPPPSAASPSSLGSLAVAEASPGVVMAYGTELARIISRGRPKGRELRNLKGRVVIEFVIASSGDLEHLAVQRSSGNPRLDDLAIASLKRLSFPPPPAAMSLRQRTIIQPFEFR